MEALLVVLDDLVLVEMCHYITVDEVFQQLGVMKVRDTGL